ncbi:MAG: cupin domain-containing protein [Candidatus Korobacteraceae bacterium]
MAVLGNWSTLPGTVPTEGVLRKVFTGKKVMMVLNEIKPGTQVNPHSHSHEQLLYIVSGSAEVVLGEEVLTMKAGDLMLVPPDVSHSLQVISKESVLNIDVFSPIREDFI